MVINPLLSIATNSPVQAMEEVFQKRHKVTKLLKANLEEARSRMKQLSCLISKEVKENFKKEIGST